MNMKASINTNTTNISNSLPKDKEKSTFSICLFLGIKKICGKIIDAKKNEDGETCII